AVQGFADLCLTTRPLRRFVKCQCKKKKFSNKSFADCYGHFFFTLSLFFKNKSQENGTEL
ncbi:MAG: hypothetical protein WCI23_06700, partial [Chlorobiaceae bacterium]